MSINNACFYNFYKPFVGINCVAPESDPIITIQERNSDRIKIGTIGPLILIFCLFVDRQQFTLNANILPVLMTVEAE